jgi:undecaprenyl-diphosphatase
VHTLSHLDAWLGTFGYLGVALGVFLESAGVPVPGETVLLAAAFAAAHGTLELPMVIAAAALAAVAGDNLGYGLGRRLGRRWLERHGRRLWLGPARLAQVDRFFARFGGWAVALGRFVTGVRVFIAASAGAAAMPWGRFVRFNVLGAVAWATLTGLAGFAAGRGWQRLRAVFGASAVAVLALALAAVVGAWGFRRLREWWLEAGVPERLRGLAWQWAWVTGMSLAATLAFARVAGDVAERETAPFDGAVRTWVLARRTPAVAAACAAGSLLGSAPLVVAVTVLAGLALWRRAGARGAVAVLLAPPLAAGGVLGLKALFARARPPGAVAMHELGHSFPSGHTTAVTAVALTLAYVGVREGLVPRGAAAAAAGVAVLVGTARVCLDVHWASDVIGGWSVGLLIATAAAALYEWRRAVRRDAPG